MSAAGPTREEVQKMGVSRMTVRGFKSIRELDLELADLNVLIGANGVGKSNFIAVFRMLNEIAEQRLQVYVRESGGANALLHYGMKTTGEICVSIRESEKFTEAGPHTGVPIANGYEAC